MESVLKIIAQGLSTDQACQVGTMTEASLASKDRKNGYYCIYCQRVEDKKKRHHFAMALLCNGFTLTGHSVTFQWLCSFL